MVVGQNPRYLFADVYHPLVVFLEGSWVFTGVRWRFSPIASR